MTITWFCTRNGRRSGQAGSGEEYSGLALIELTSQWLHCAQSSPKGKIYNSWTHGEHKARNPKQGTLVLLFHSQTSLPSSTPGFPIVSWKFLSISQKTQIQIISSISVFSLRFTFFISIGSEPIHWNTSYPKSVHWKTNPPYLLNLEVVTLDMSRYVTNFFSPFAAFLFPS